MEGFTRMGSRRKASRQVSAILLLLAALALPDRPAFAAESPWDRYLWQTARTTKIVPSARSMVGELRSEVQKILDAGPLAPVQMVYADLVQDEYFLYWQPGRIVTTLARAYPYLTPAQQQAVKRYVRAEMDDPDRAPWTARGHLLPDKGARREIHSFHQGYGWDRYWGLWGSKKPIMGVFYGLWLYADRTGDWATLKRHYSEIADLYTRRSGQCNLYGTMAAPIAMARIAEHLGDAKRRDGAVAEARAALAAGTSFAAVEARTRSYWPERYQPRQAGLVYQGWMFLDLSPEAGRYLADHVKKPALERHRQGLRQYPLFWLREVPYWSRWTGDEGLGIPTELMGMIVPVERWVAGVSAATLARYTRSAPLCIGDCYWLEALIDAIEVTGATTWVDVRGSHSARASVRELGPGLGEVRPSALLGVPRPEAKPNLARK